MDPQNIAQGYFQVRLNKLFSNKSYFQATSLLWYGAEQCFPIFHHCNTGQPLKVDSGKKDVVNWIYKAKEAQRLR